MKGVLYVIVIFVLILMLYKKNIDAFINKTLVCNKVDNSCYYVIERFDEKEKASENLGKINLFLNNIIEYMDNKYNKEQLSKGKTWETFELDYYLDLIERMKNNYDNRALTENDPKDSINTSYVENKGEVFALCLREKITDERKIHDYNLLQFVALHELAHLSCKSYGHGDEFWTNFKILLRNAKETKLYSPIDYSRYPENYCSLNLDSNPYFIESIKS